MTSLNFLNIPEHSAEAQRIFDDDVAEAGYVMSVSRLWAHQPAALTGLFDVVDQVIETHGLTFRQRGILVSACASALGDATCALVWGARLAGETDEHLAAAVLRGDDDGLTSRERAMAAWARKIVRDPNGTAAADVQELRDAGFTDTEVFGITVFVGMRVAFSTVNDALGVRPDAALRHTAPPAVLDAVTFGRPIEDEQTSVRAG